MNKPTMRAFERFAKITLHRYERYLPTAFDESLTLLEKMNKLIEYLNEMGLLVNDVVDQWNEVMEWVLSDGINDVVVNRLDEMVDDGTLATIINEHIFEELNTRIDGVESDFSDFKDEINTDFSNFKDDVNERLDRFTYNIKDFGAVGDGVTNDTQAFKDAGETGQKIIVPPGEYIITDTVYMESGTHFIGDGYSTKIINPTHSKFVVFRGQGSFSTEQSIIENVTTGATEVRVGSTDEFETGDYIRLMSQRDAMHREDAGDFWMGVQTSSNDRLYLGEIKRITNVSGNRLQFYGGLLFPDYNTNNNDETSLYARDNATVEKINFTHNLKVANMSFHGGFLSPVRFYTCRDSSVEDIVWEDARDGELVYFRQSYNCVARNSYVSFNTDIEPNNYYSRNALKTVSSFNCGFIGCTVVNGTQSIDFTYGPGPTLIDVDSYAIGCTIIGAHAHAGTSHPGTYRSVFKDNAMTDCHADGILSRSNQAVITGNKVVGPGNSVPQRTYGIRINQGAAINTIIDGNNISNFDTGAGSISGANGDFDYMGLTLTNNVITSINTAIEFRRSNTSPKDVQSRVLVQGNRAYGFIGTSARFIHFYRFFRGFTIMDNHFIGNRSVGRGISSLGDVFDLDIRNNTLLNAGVGIQLGDVVSDVFNVSSYPIKWDNNTTSTAQNVEGRMNAAIGNCFFVRHHHFGGLYPYQPNSNYLGFNDYRWTGIYTVNQPNVASDYRLKENIMSINEGLNIIKQLNPVRYNMKSDGALNYGLLAQEVEQVIENGVITKPVGDNEYYGMSYEALIPFLIKAVQELSDKIDGR